MNIESSSVNDSTLQTPNKRTTSDIEDENNTNIVKKPKNNETSDINGYSSNTGEVELQVNATNVSFNDTQETNDNKRRLSKSPSKSRSRSRSTSKQRRSKSPSMESSKSESVSKEVPMSGDRNRFSRSKSPKARWHNLKDSEV
jgi:hypothetical protein